MLWALTLLLALFGLDPFNGQVVAVVDGDTITVLNAKQEIVRVRVEGIDCPEGAQPFSEEARDFTAQLVFAQSVLIQPKEMDDFGRLVGRVSVDGKDLSLALLQAGLAWHFKRFDSDPQLAEAEEAAQSGRRGLFGDPAPVPPWLWRQQHRDDPTRTRLELRFALYRGNVSSKTFHSPACRYYACKNCTRVFRSRDEASRAGYRAHSGRGGCVE